MPGYWRADGSYSDGSSDVQLTGSNVQDVVLQNAATAIGNGSPLTVGGLKTLTIEIFATGTSPTFTVVFEGASKSGTYYAISAVNLNSMSIVTQTSAAGVYQVDLTGFATVRTRISTIGGTSPTVTVQGKAVA